MASFRTSGITFTTASGTKTVVLTPAAGDLPVIVCANTGQNGAPGISDNNTNGASGNYSLITSARKNASADLMQIYVRNTLITNTNSTTFTMTPGTTTGGGLCVLMISGMPRMGANAVRGSGASANQSAATPTVSWGQAALTGNLVLGAVFNATTTAATMTPPSGWSERHDVGYSTPTTGLEVATDDSGETRLTIPWGSASASAYCAMIVEMDTTTPTMPPQTLSVPMRTNG